MNDSKNKKHSAEQIFNWSLEYSNNPPVKYVVYGEPIPWRRPGRTQAHVYDTQKKQKLSFQLQLQNSREIELYTGPLALIVRFFMPIPVKMSEKQRQLMENKPYAYTPDIDNCIKFVCDACQGLLFENDKSICVLTASKCYSLDEPRTEFYLLKLT